MTILDAEEASEAVTADNLLSNSELRAESSDLLEMAAEEFDRDDDGLNDMRDERILTKRKANGIQNRTEQMI